MARERGPATVSPWRSADGLDTPEAIIAAIDAAREAGTESGVRFRWPGAAHASAIPLTSLDGLVSALIGATDPRFDADARLDAAIERLPIDLVADVRARRSSLRLESLWLVIEAREHSRPRFALTVSIALSRPTLMPFAASRVRLRIGPSSP